VRGARLGVARAYFGYHPEVDRLVDAAIATLRSLGAEVIDPVDLGPMPELGAAELEVLLTELRASLGEYLAALPPAVKVRSLADVIAFNRAHAAEEMPHFGQELFEQAQAKGPLTSPAYLKARALCERVARTEGIDRVLRAHRLDAIIAPTTGPAWRIDPLLGDHFVGGSSTPAAVAGYPSVTVPVGFVAGMPVGASLFAGRFAEARLLGLALALEAATSHRRPPTYAATIPGPGACGAS
jgi:amidase